MTVSRSEVVGVAHWLLDYEVGGRLYRLAVEPVDVVDAQGETLHYSAGLADLEVTIGSSAPTATIVLGDVEDWALLEARGVDLGSGTAILRRWYQGQVLERARVLVRGGAADPEYGAVGEGLTFSIERRALVARRPLPDDDAKISSQSWPVNSTAAIDPDLDGVVYPIVFGRPGWSQRVWYTDGSIPRVVTGSPAYLVEAGGFGWDVDDPGYRTGKLLLAGHEVQAPHVTVFDLTAGEGRGGATPEQKAQAIGSESPLQWETAEVFAVAHMRDNLGRKVAYVVATLAESIYFTPGHEYWVSWTHGGGLYNRERTGPLRGAGEIIEWLLDYGGVPVDRGRMAGGRKALDEVRLDFAIVEQVDDVEAWIADHLGGLLPLVRRESEEGVWYELRRYHAERNEVAARLVVAGVAAADGTTTLYDAVNVDGIPVRRDGPVGKSPVGEVRNEIVVQYAPRSHDQLTRSVTLTGDPTKVQTSVAGLGAQRRAVLGSYVCEVSRARYGGVERRVEIPARLIHDDDSAALVAQIHARARALQRRQPDVTGPLLLDTLDIQDVVELDDDRMHIENEMAIVREMVFRRESVTVHLELLDAVETRSRAT